MEGASVSGALKVVGAIAGTIAPILPPPFNVIAAATAAVANIGAALLQKKPPAQGSTSDIRIGSNNPMPYAMGRTYVGGTLVHDVGYGPTTGGVPNPYRALVFIGSGGGPVQSIESFKADFATVSFSGGNAVGYYHDFMHLDTQLGATPESSALSGPWGAITGWGAGYKLSGYAAWLVSLKFDKKGKVYAGGVPRFGAVLQGVKVYDPRQDDTYPGGSGAARALDEDTYVGGDAAKNPGCHGVTYALGRWQGAAPKKVMGCGFDPAAIDWPAWVEFMNTCDANGWEIGGTVFEPGSRWDNLKRICQAGGGKPCWVGGKLSVTFPRPRVSLDTITRDDLADGEGSIPAMQSTRARKNGLIPRYRSEAHNWEMVQANLVEVEEYVTEDGEQRSEELALDLVQDKDQAVQLAAYELVDRREMSPIVLPCKPRLIEYRPGDALTIDLPEEGLPEQFCTVIGRRIDPASGIVELTLMSETTAKHAFALGQTGTAPPTPSLPTGEDLDTLRDELTYRSTPHVVASEAEMLALDAVEGEVAIRTDLSTTFIHNGGTTGTAADWTEALSPVGVTSVAGKTGAVTLVAADITDFAEATDDRVSTLLTAGANIGLTYDDGLGTLTVAVTGLGTMAAQNANAVAITGGSVNDISSLRITASNPSVTIKDSDTAGSTASGFLNIWDSANAVRARIGKVFADGVFYLDNTDAGFRFTIGGSTRMFLDTTNSRLDLNSGYVVRINSQTVLTGRLAALPADATDLATVITLANAIKARMKATGGHGFVAD